MLKIEEPIDGYIAIYAITLNGVPRYQPLGHHEVTLMAA
jgi:hypothetical protein